MPVNTVVSEISDSYNTHNIHATTRALYKLCLESVSPPGTRIAISPSKSELIPWSTALLEKQPVAQLLKNFTTFYGTRRFITVFSRALHWSLS
jgi:hypothetical protein